MGRGWATVALGLVAGVAWSCGSSSRFTCLDDGVCTLAGVQGVCVDDGHCAYPDDACGSGLAYPAGSTPELAGMCAPGIGDTSLGGDDDDDDRDDDDDDDPDDDDDDDADDDDDDDADDDDDDDDDMTSGGIMATGGLTGGGGTDTGGPACPDTVGDQPFTGEVVGGCEAGGQSTLTDFDDIDWYQFFGPGASCPADVYEVNVDSDAPVQACLIAGCRRGRPGIECDNGDTPTNVSGFEACCGTPPVTAYLACGLDGDFDPFMLVTLDSDGFVCSDYDWSLTIPPRGGD